MGINLHSIAVLAELTRYKIHYKFGSGDEVAVCCPFHKDGQEENPSCFINTKSRLFNCQTGGCEKSGDIVTLLAQHTKVSRNDIIVQLSQHYDLENERTVDPLAVERWHEAIWKADALRNELYERGLTDKLIRYYRFGCNGERITIPIPSNSGAYVNVRLYLPGAPGNLKMKNSSGFGKQNQWFPVQQLKYDELLLTGGECKAIVAADQLNKNNVGAITGTWGEKGKIPPAMLRELQGKRIYVCMDVDKSGIEASIKVAKILQLHDIWCSILSLPLDIDKYPKGDINDFCARERGELYPLVQEAEEYRANFIDKSLQDIAEPESVELAESVHADNSNKRIKVKGVVSHLQDSPFFVPKDITIKCERDQTYCLLCPVYVKDRNEFSIPRESPSIIEFIGAPTSYQLEIVKSAIGVPRICKVAEFDKLSEYNVESARVSPQIEIDNRGTDRQPIAGFCVGAGLTLNEGYRFTGKLLPHPKTQEATLLVSEYEPVQDALSAYTIDDAEQLGAFWPKEWTLEGIDEKLNEIYADLEFNASQIRGRRSLHLAIDLAYHSPLLINFDGQNDKGWIDLLVLGDSGNGKSKCIENLVEFYGLGRIYDCSNSTVAGLLGGMEKYNDKWFITWGVIPQNDRHLVVIEEVKEAPTEALAKLRDMRSRGVAQNVKIGGNRQANARTRSIWVSNPRNGCQVNSYSYGVLAIRELIGAREDVRRFDFAVITTDIVVPPKSPVPHVYTGDLCRELILWAWTRTREQVIFLPETIQTIIEEAEKLCGIFSIAIPLVDLGTMKFKLARLAASLAARLFSSSEDCQSIVVYPVHAQYIAKMLYENYAAPEFGYLTFSQGQELLTKLLNPEELKKTILNTAFPKDFCRSMLAQDYIEIQDLGDWGSVDHGRAQAMMSLFVRKHALIRRGKYYRKTPPFIEFLKSMEADDDTPDKPESTQVEF